MHLQTAQAGVRGVTRHKCRDDYEMTGHLFEFRRARFYVTARDVSLSTVWAWGNLMSPSVMHHSALSPDQDEEAGKQGSREEAGGER